MKCKHTYLRFLPAVFIVLAATAALAGSHSGAKRAPRNYVFFGRDRDRITGIAIQDGNYELPNPKTGTTVTIAELVGFASDYLNVTYLFWCTQEPFYSRDVVPHFQRDK